MCCSATHIFPEQGGFSADAGIVGSGLGRIFEAKGTDGLADILAGSESLLETPAHRRLLTEQPGYAEFNDRKFRSTSSALYAAMAPAFIRVGDRLDQLMMLPPSLSVLVVVGEQDRPFVGPAERMAAAIPGASLAVIPDAGHSPQFENPDGWWDALSTFLAEIMSAADR
jgi:pimeloyl-ACP methyl ester carboxylesterase